jgi:hypothetical protein
MILFRCLSHSSRKSFNIRTEDLPTGNPDIVESLKELSFLKYGRPRDEVEKEVMDKFMKI